MLISLRDLTDYFGKKSPLAQQMMPQFYKHVAVHALDYQQWQQTITLSKTLKIDDVAQQFGILDADAIRLIFSLQTYYVIIIKALAANKLGNIHTQQALEDGSHFIAHGIENFTTAHDYYQWYLDEVDVSEIIQLTAQCDFDTRVTDALKALYHDLFPRTIRHTLGEYYTPDWFAEFVLNRIDFRGHRRILDPTCGSGTFIVLAYQRLLAAGIENPLDYLAGIDVNPLACLSAKVNLILNMAKTKKTPITLPIYCADVLLDPPDIGKFDCIVGNPPWVNWETLADEYRQATRDLWERYHLFPHSGFDTILGKGKKDLSLVLTYAVVDQYLAPHGTLAFIMTQSVLKTGGAASGFRRFDFANPLLRPQHVDDFSKMRLFSGAETKPIVLVLSHDAPQPPSYYLWQAKKKTIRDTADISILNTLRYSDFVAEPIDEVGSAWLTGKPAALQAVRKIIGQSDYTAHAGVYTGGANAVYWLEVLARDGHLVQVRNIIEGSKRRVEQVETWLEADLVYPLLRGRDVGRWQANPTVHILMVQNVETRQGYDGDWLQANYPRTYDYLRQFERILLERATVKRYFRDNVPFYTMFDIGAYTFQPYKVIWHGFGKRRMEAVVVGSVDGKAIMSNQAMHPFIGLDDENEAHYLAACLNSAPFEFAVLSHTQSGGKSFAQPGILETLRIPQYDPDNVSHQHLMTLSRNAHQGTIDDIAIADASAALWDLSVSELNELQQSLHNLVT